MPLTQLAPAALLVGLVLVPLLALVVDLLMAPASTAFGSREFATSGHTADDFTVLVPIYGDVTYLENVDYLRRYGAKVMLCTTSGESAHFYDALRAIAEENDFKVFVSTFRPTSGQSGRRQTGGVTRDGVIRDALQAVTSEYVVCVDADTRTDEALERMVGEVVRQNLDLASVRLVVANDRSMLARLQRHEYRMSMRMRRLMPWLCSGACHMGRTMALRHAMSRHSLFFQGNDAELGLVAYELGFKIGHLPFAVPTTVPDSLTTWWRQRFAWSGGEFRLYVVNARLALRHPFFISYGALLVFALSPMRIISITHPGLVLLAVLGAYWGAVVAANRKYFDTALMVYPIYGLLNSLLITPLGVLAYLNMAIGSRNAGLIRSRKSWVPVLREPPDTSPPMGMAPQRFRERQAS